MKEQTLHLVKIANRAANFMSSLNMRCGRLEKEDLENLKSFSSDLNDSAEQVTGLIQNTFVFEISQKVALKDNPCESGEILGRAEYATSENQYFIRYKNGNNVTVENGWAESALNPA